MAQAGGPVFSPVVARRPTRVSAAAASAGFLLLLAALVLANSSGRRGPFRASVEESAAAWARAQSAKNVALAKHTQVASSGPKTAPADPANLTPAARSHAQSRITGLKAEVEAEQHKASGLDATVSDEAAMIRDALLKAKKMQREATRAKTKAVERRQQVSPCFARLGPCPARVSTRPPVSQPAGWGTETSVCQLLTARSRAGTLTAVDPCLCKAAI